MFFLFLSVACTVAMFVLFRLFALRGISTFQAVVFNYLFCVLTGVVFVEQTTESNFLNTWGSWGWWAVMVGTSFVITFNLMGQTVRFAGLTSASIASKMSMVIPVLAALYVFNDGSIALSKMQWSGLGFALVAILLTSLTGSGSKIEGHKNKLAVVLPLAVFFLSGVVDTLVNQLSARFTGEAGFQHVFIQLFMVAAGLGFVALAVALAKGWEKWHPANLIAGLLLGVPNYFSIHFLLMALAEFNQNGALIFPMANVGTIILSVAVSMVLFKEKLTLLKYFGVAAAVLAIVLLAWEHVDKMAI